MSVNSVNNGSRFSSFSTVGIDFIHSPKFSNLIVYAGLVYAAPLDKFKLLPHSVEPYATCRFKLLGSGYKPNKILLNLLLINSCELRKTCFKLPLHNYKPSIFREKSLKMVLNDFAYRIIFTISNFVYIFANYFHVS